MSRRAMLAALISAPLLFSSSACSTRSDAAAGPVVFVDAAGNRMVVDVEATRVAPPAQVSAAASASSPASLSVAGAVDEATVVPAVPPAPGNPGLSVSDYPDADGVLAKSREASGDRFFVVPDGTGRTVNLAVDGGTLDAARSAPRTPVVAAAWQSCRLVLPLLEAPPGTAQQVEFPASDGRRKFAGYLIDVPAGTEVVELWSFERRGGRAEPLLAKVDGEGRVVAIVNNMPTESIPETRFAYARVGGKRFLTDVPAEKGRHLALLDLALIHDRLPAACIEGLALPAGAAPQPVSRPQGRVSLYFLGKR